MLGVLSSPDFARTQGLVSLCATLGALGAVAAEVFLYGPYFAAGVTAPLLASIRWAKGEDTRVRALAPADRADEEPFVLAALLDDRALFDSGSEPDRARGAPVDADPPLQEPAGRAEIEGLLARAQAYCAPSEDPFASGDERPGRG